MRYAGTAALLGAGWFLVLMVPGTTREWLLASPALNLVSLIASSVLTALAFRRFISSADTIGSQLWRAVAIPYAGCAILLTIVNASIWTRSLLTGGLANLHDTFSLYAMGLMATTFALYVVVPYGLLCQRVMYGICREADRSTMA